MARVTSDVGVLRARLRERRGTLAARFQHSGNVGVLLRAAAREVDRLLVRAACADGVDRFATVVAVGGYGRGELFPYSDVDVLILTDESPGDAQLAAIETLIAKLWDIGLQLGHSVRTIAECRSEAARDLTVLTALLESRWIAGARQRYAEFERAIAASYDAAGFFQAKLLEQQQRHTKYQDTPYALEPNCKESPGGLRDLHMLLWVTRAAGFGASWSELLRRGLITREEHSMLARSERALEEIRARLHLVAGRREDRLVFDVQTAVAASAGLQAKGGRRASEVLMQRYYRAAKIVTQLNTIVLQNVEAHLFPRAEQPAVRIDAAFVARNEMLDIDDDRVLEQDPNAILRCFLLRAQHGELKGMSARLLRALWHARDRIDAAFRADPANRRTFVAILQQQFGVTHELRRMNQWAILGRYLPVFRRIVGQMQHDLFHAYTVDQHILIVVRNLRRFTLAKFAHEYPLCSQLIADFDRAWLLYVAALFHDIAKGRGGDHSTLGRRDALRFCQRHGFAREDTALVAFLVEQHLTMSQVAQKQDLADPAVIERFARIVGSERRLIALYLLTVADIRGTSPRVWNAWKARLLEDLFHLTRRRLGGQPVAPTAALENRKRDALRVLQLYGVSAQAHEPLWRQLDVVYFLRHTAKDIAWHTRTLLAHVEAERPIVRARLSDAGAGVEVLVYVRDQKDLFARVCGFFDSRNLSILDARIHTTRHGYALDTLIVSDQGRAGHFRELIARIEADLAAWIGAETALPEPVKGRLSRHSRHFPVVPGVHLQPDERGSAHLLSITATDRVGLLYAITRVLARHGINVQTARINTLGERVEDVFLIEGTELESQRGQLQLETDLLAALAH